MEVKIRQTKSADLEDILHVEREAFGEDDEAILTQNLLNDPTAQPAISLLAFHNDQAIGHLIYTRSYLSTDKKIMAYILGPLAVLPKYQKMGIGQKLMNAGDLILKDMDVDIVFVLGHPSYYPKNGFINDAESRGFKAPYEILPKNADAWMYKIISPNILEGIKAKVICCEAFDQQEYWEE